MDAVLMEFFWVMHAFPFMLFTWSPMVLFILLTEVYMHLFLQE